MSPIEFNIAIFIPSLSLSFPCHRSQPHQDPQMTQRLFLTPFTPLISLVIVTSFLLLPERFVCTDQRFLNCSNLRTCGDDQIIRFPFFIQEEQAPYCGYPRFNLSCKLGKPILRLSSDDYIVREIFYENQSLRVSNAAVFDPRQTCIPPFHNLSLLDERFRFPSPDQKALSFLYNCSSDMFANNSDLSRYKVNCPDGKGPNSSSSSSSTLVMFDDDPLLGNVSDKCGNTVAAPVNEYMNDINTAESLQVMLERGFLLSWTASNCNVCAESGGQCGFNETTYHFQCFCPDRPHALRCNTGANKLPLELGLGLGIGCLCMLIMLLYIFHRRYRRKHATSNLTSTNSSSEPFSKSDLQGGSFFFGVPVYSYKELEEATTNFDGDKELGDGGFGTVYYGKLRDGREVAVKRLYEHNYRRHEQFMNEIAILTRLRHKNLVSLYGCTSRQSRELLLVYEYIPNGTVADHLHGDRANFNLLTWPVRMRIAIETASALAYLHASDVVHRDVKTSNILLDDNFSVKVADFGLSRLFPADVSHVSTAPQGTPGYVDPEYHQCYQLTGKSDVYSFGVVMIELVSSKPAVDITRERSEINLANLAINKIKQCALDELIDAQLGYKTNGEVKRMTASVAELAFRCLQQDKEMRPSMEEVLEELNKIEMGEQERNQEEIRDVTMGSKAAKTPSSPLYCDEAALLKNIRPPPSPDSVTNKWMSSSSTTPSVSS